MEELPSVLRYEEIDRFLLAIDNFEDMIPCRLMLFGGLRVNEAINVRVRDIDPERCAVFVKRGKGGKDRWSPLDVHTVSLIQTVVKARGMRQEKKFVDFCKRTMQRHVSAIAERAQIPWNMTCHSLRHTCANWQLDKGIPLEVVKENLGHSDILTT